MDVLMVWKLDRLTRSLKDLPHLLKRIQAAGTGFRSVTEAIDTTTPGRPDDADANARLVCGIKWIGEDLYARPGGMWYNCRVTDPEYFVLSRRL
jgi:hypothetical protein